MLKGPAGALDPFGTVPALVKGEMLGAAPAPRRVVASAAAAEPRHEAVRAAAPAPVAAVSDTAPRTRRCWRCKEPVELPAESGGERPRCAKCGTLQWVPV